MAQGNNYHKQIEDLESGFLRQRRNLLGISTGILIYCIAGGSIEKANLLFGIVDVTRPIILEACIWIFLFYALWRYWLYREPVEKEFHYSKINEVCRNIIFNRIVEGILSNREAATPNNKRPIIKCGIFKRYLDFSQSHQSDKVVGTLQREVEEWKYEDAPIIKVNFFLIEMVQLWCSLKVALKNRAFSDYCLPYLMFSLAIVAGISKYVLGA